MNRPDDILVRDVLAFSPQPRPHLAYPKRTDDCPSLARFPEGVSNGWSKKEDDRVHVSGCPYCKLRTAKQWVITPPTPLTLAFYLAGESLDEEAMGIYLSWPEGDGARRLLQRSVYVRARAILIRGKEAAKEAGAKIKGFGAESWRAGLELARQLEPSYASGGSSRAVRTRGSSNQQPAPRVRDVAGHVSVGTSFEEGTELLGVATRDHSVTAEVALLTSDSLKIHVSSAIENSGRRVLVELVPEEGESVQVEFQLAGQEAADLSESEQVVMVPNMSRFLRNSSLLVAWIS
jgi:hypothetical protein